MQKQRNHTSKNAKRASAKKMPEIQYAFWHNSKWRHLRLIHHRHTAKLIHRRHTSYLLLLGLLLVVGLFVYASQSLMNAAAYSTNGLVTISSTVNGPPPTKGATITSPIDGATVSGSSVELDGTCEPNTLVVIYLAGVSDGSDTCTSSGVFHVTVQIQPGSNVLQAYNYDNLNQPGPSTPPIMLLVSGGSSISQSAAPVNGSNHNSSSTSQLTARSSTSSSAPSVLSRPFCGTYTGADLSSSGPLHIATSCITRSIQPGQVVHIGIGISGGTAPYAMAIDWGDKTQVSLVSVSLASYQSATHTYLKPGSYAVNIRVTDKTGTSAFVQTVNQVNGVAPSLVTTLTKDITQTSWFNTPVPFYLLALALTLGFWIGDVFDRHFGTSVAQATYPRKPRMRVRH